ncbi:putative bifunctional diguanylate cyclase/phosphodiesterase [Sphingomonas sp. R1]|uniref:putative bifunctional diguanylate cyclase/phosphodiesterase n=1 Tax=Sphingomonas sp. R1 TaxID=399176 RepID=UPI0022258ED1|nr:EAL domain-containing protein [Sphingomonas sp. R1]UYY77729.1 EAL domain-containing protein [Sphingomonas sp. R1]
MTRDRQQDGQKTQRQRTAAIYSALASGAVLLAGGIAAVLAFHVVRQTPPPGWLLGAQILDLAILLLCWRRINARAARRRTGDRLHQFTSRDPLTGFHNRHSLTEEGAAMFARAHRRNQAMAMLVLDLDRFKAISDLHGHEVADALVRHVADEIVDALPPMALTGRLGVDEFACAFGFDPRDPATVERVAERIVTRLAQPFEVDGTPLHIGCSLGIARSDFDCPSAEALLRTADIAMHQAQKAGRNRFAWFDPAMERALQVRSALESGLRMAIPRQEIVPYFEQQVDLASGRLHGFEVLARWEHPSQGTIGPDHFIPVAEETGLIGELSLAIMRQAFHAARDWDPGLSLSVNISPVQLRDAWLAQKIIKVLTETGFPAHRLEVEVTESALFDNLALAQSIVGSLKNQGVRLALDDFGTGYSSLAHLRALPFDRIKIDKSFVLSINQNADSAAIVQAIVRLGESLNLPITAEGVEDATIEERLRALGCAKAQGWHYGRPMSIPSTRRLLAERRLILQPAPRPTDPETTSRRQAG